MNTFKPIYLKKIKNLGLIPRDKLKRKFFIKGTKHVGKTKVIQDVYDSLLKVDWEDECLEFAPELRFGKRQKYKVAFPTQKVKIAGFKTGDLTTLNFQDKVRLGLTTDKDLIEYKAKTIDQKHKIKYGIKTLDGKHQAEFEVSDDSPFWEIATQELMKNADIYIFDELSEWNFGPSYWADKFLWLGEHQLDKIIVAATDFRKKDIYEDTFVDKIKRDWKDIEWYDADLSENMDHFKKKLADDIWNLEKKVLQVIDESPDFDLDVKLNWNKW